MGNSESNGQVYTLLKKELAHMAIHLKDFEIHQYKGIQALKLESLNSINLLTGNNNCGKTSVLEILSTVDNPQDMGSWILCSRLSNVPARRRLFYNGFYHMFPIDIDEKLISYTYKDKHRKSNTVVLKAEFEKTQISESEMYRINRLMSTSKRPTDEEFVDTICMHLYTYFNDELVNEDLIYDFQNMMTAFVDKKKTFVRTTYVSPVDHAQGTIFLSQIMSDPELYEELISILREFDDSIISVNAVNNDSAPYATEYQILTKKHEKALPLNSYGDGMKKALLLLSAVVKSRDGILLLDEFETAIHTSAMNTIFTWLLKSALKLNVQVFLTSHSKEAIDKLLKVDSELQPFINLYTLYDYKGKNYVRMMRCHEAINAQDNLGLELR